MNFESDTRSRSDTRSSWKKILAEMLKKIGLIREDFTGKVTINLNQGGVVDVEKAERLK